MASLTGKTALVTGATWIGFGIARHFLLLGASVVIHGRDQANAARAAAELGPDATASTAVSADLRDVAACRTMMQAAIAWKGGLDVLVNNAGMVDRGYLENAPVELWDDIMAVNLRAPFICLQEAVASMKNARRRIDRQHRIGERAHRRAEAGPVFGVERRADDDDPQRGVSAPPLQDPGEPAERRMDAHRERRRRPETGGHTDRLAG